MSQSVIRVFLNGIITLISDCYTFLGHLAAADNQAPRKKISLNSFTRPYNKNFGKANNLSHYLTFLRS